MMNIATKPIAKSSGVLKRMSPPHSVPNQLKILIPVGTAMNMVDRAKAEFATGPSPTANMWWAHTPQPMKPIAMPAKTMAAYPNIGLRAKVGSTSETMPIAGKIMM
jgi:hypothetical protein